MRIYTSNVASPYEIATEIFSCREPFHAVGANGVPPSKSAIGSNWVYRVFNPAGTMLTLGVLEVLTRMPDSATGVSSRHGFEGLGRKLPYPIVACFVRRPPDPMFESFSIIPAPKRPYGSLINLFLTERIPPMSVYIGGYMISSMTEGMRPISELPSAPFVGNESFVYETEQGGGLVITPLMSFRVEYANRLELLWEFPSVGMSPWQLLEHEFNWMVAVKFEHPDDPAILVMKSSALPSDEGRWVYRNRHLFADTLAMVSALIGYTSLDKSELALLLLDWWGLAVGNYAYHLKSEAARKTSVLLLSDMMARAGSDMVAEMAERMLRKKAFDVVYRDLDIGGVRHRYTVPILQRDVSLDHLKLLKVWNLARTQMGLHPVNRENYTEVPHVFDDTGVSPAVRS